MKLSYLMFLAYKNLYGHKMRTILTAGGVAISVGFVVFLISLGFGLQKVSTTQIANLEALQILDVSITKSKLVTLNDETMDKFRDLGNVIEAYPQVSSATKITYNTSEIDGVVYGKSTDFLKLEEVKMASGRKFSEDTADEAIINLAAQTQLSAGDIIDKDITLNVIVRSELLSKDEKSKQFEKKLKVVGIIDDKSAPYVYVPMHVFSDNGVVNYSGAKIKMNSKEAVDQAKLQVENMGFKATSVKETVDQINQFFGVFQIILISFGAIAIIVACLGMFNTLTISLLEKTREVGFMKALGTTRKDIYKLFTFESILIGTLGSTTGVLIGFLLGKMLNYSILGLAKATGNQPVEIFYIPFYMMALILGTSLLISLLTGFYPARRAAKISPLDALRYE